MSTGALEKLFWQIHTKPEEVKRYCDDPGAYLRDFRLDEDEREMVLSWDVGEMAARGVNQMLLQFAFTAVNGMGKHGEYIMKLREAKKTASNSEDEKDLPWLRS